jgi:hypothetical protein
VEDFTIFLYSALTIRRSSADGGDRLMRPRAIQSVPGLDPNGSPFERFRQFAKMVAVVPKSELEKRQTSLVLPKGGPDEKQRGNKL